MKLSEIGHCVRFCDMDFFCGKRFTLFCHASNREPKRPPEPSALPAVYVNVGTSVGVVPNATAVL